MAREWLSLMKFLYSGYKVTVDTSCSEYTNR